MVAAEDYFKNIEAVHSGNLEVRLAENNQEIDAAQALRYKVFYDEMSAKPVWRCENLREIMIVLTSIGIICWL